MSKKTVISNLLRKFGILFFSDKMVYSYKRNKMKKLNEEFRKEHPEFKLPPDYLMYESYQINYRGYYVGGKKTAEFLKNLVEKYIIAENLKILDWGCGPARVVRHLPEVFGNNNRFFGTDYNAESIKWNNENIKNVEFNLNSLKAELPYENEFFDFIYGISIFTHLSEKLHYEWVAELSRVLKKDGLVMMTLQGEKFREILSQAEKENFDKGKLVVRDQVKEGHRMFSAFHPDNFVKKLFENFEILEHQNSFSENGNLLQDTWLFRKK